MNIIIYIHRRDLRINDNLSLYKCLSTENSLVIPIFIFDENQIIQNEKNKYYFSKKSAYFVINSVIDLKDQYKNIGSNLLVLYGKPHECLEKLIKKIKNVYAIGFNLDYSKYSLKRDKEIIKICKDYKCLVINDNEMSDYCLIPWTGLVKEENQGYKQFGAFYKNALKSNVIEPLSYKKLYGNFINKKIFTKYFENIDFNQTDFEELMDPTLKFLDEGNRLLNWKKKKDKSQWLNAGRNNCLTRLKKMTNHLKTYNTDRNSLSYETSNISAYLNIGSVSVREIYVYFKNNVGKNSELIKQLYWRDFYLTSAIYLENGNEYYHMDTRYNSLKWHSNSPKTNKDKQNYKQMHNYWKLMLTAKTGFLLIDAGINELIHTGFLHGRLRMILGMFWTKYLLINPFDNKYGSQTGYSKLLVDAIGVSQNKFNHQWITEFDFPGKKFSPSNAPLAGRPMRIDNEQIKKFDPECIYIKKWLPQFKNIDNKDIYKWSDIIAEKYNNIHPSPIFDSKEKYKQWIDLCSNI